MRTRKKGEDITIFLIQWPSHSFCDSHILFLFLFWQDKKFTAVQRNLRVPGKHPTTSSLIDCKRRSLLGLFTQMDPFEKCATLQVRHRLGACSEHVLDTKVCSSVRRQIGSARIRHDRCVGVRRGRGERQCCSMYFFKGSTEAVHALLPRRGAAFIWKL